MAEQLGLPGVEPAQEDAFPDEVQAALNVVMGAASDKDIRMVTGAEDPTPEEDHLRHGVSREKLIKNSDKREKRIVKSNYRVEVFDLAQKDHAKAYQDLLELAGDPKEQWTVEETPSAPMIDPASEVGYRVLRTVRMFKQKIEVEIKNPGYTEVSVKTSPANKPEQQG